PLDDGIGGGLLFEEVGTPTAPDPPIMLNTIVALNHAAMGPDCNDAAKSSGHNVESHTSCGFISLGDLQNTEHLLGRLQGTGGPASPLALLPGSPAKNHGDDVGCPGVDQRGVHRPQGPHCDIGAFEAKPR